MKSIILAGGCFWGVEAYYKRVKGVTFTKVGYSNGKTKNPSYKEVCTGETEHAEVCYIKYDENIISLDKILEHFFRIIDPTSLNRQGADIGTQYRTGIFYIDREDSTIIKEFITKEQEKYNNKIVVEIEELSNYYDAETYHQSYLEKNPTGYCHVDLNLLKSLEKQLPIN